MNVGILALGTRRAVATAEQEAAAELRSAPPPRVFTRPTMGGVGAAIAAVAATLPAAKHTSHDSNHHDAFDDAHFAASDEDDIPFDFDNSKTAGPQDHHDAPF